jgi:hypothetical protein
LISFWVQILVGKRNWISAHVRRTWYYFPI